MPQLHSRQAMDTPADVLLLLVQLLKTCPGAGEIADALQPELLPGLYMQLDMD
jgi:hypothetical protein